TLRTRRPPRPLAPGTGADTVDAPAHTGRRGRRVVRLRPANDRHRDGSPARPYRGRRAGPVSPDRGAGRAAAEPGRGVRARTVQDGGMDLRIFTEPQQGATYDTLLTVAKATEDLGFDAFFRSDHYLKMGSVDGLPGPTDAWITLAGLARETSRIRLGTLMTAATFRLPGVLAIQVAQVDQMSGGRIELGLGAGWFEEEHKAYGIPFPKEKFGRLEEQLEIVTGLWATGPGKTFDFHGTYYDLTGSPALPKPVQSRI